jgi:hypothetical protein
VRHRETSCEIILGLATSLGSEHEALRRTFLSAPPVAGVLGECPVAISAREQRDGASV